VDWDVKGVSDCYTGPVAHLVFLVLLAGACIVVGYGVRLVADRRRDDR
jgi:hypothetical protein